MESASRGNLSLVYLQQLTYFYGAKSCGERLICETLTRLSERLNNGAEYPTIIIRRATDGQLITENSNQVFQLFQDTVDNPAYIAKTKQLSTEISAIHTQIGYPSHVKYRITQKLRRNFLSDNNGRDPTSEQLLQLQQDFYSKHRLDAEPVLHTLPETYPDILGSNPSDQQWTQLDRELCKRRMNLYQVRDSDGNLLYPRRITRRYGEGEREQVQRQRQQHNNHLIQALNDVLTEITQLHDGEDFVHGFLRSIPTLGEPVIADSDQLDVRWITKHIVDPTSFLTSPREAAISEIEMNPDTALSYGETGYVSIADHDVQASGLKPFSLPGEPEISFSVRNEINWWVNRLRQVETDPYPNQEEYSWIYRDYQPDDTSCY